MCIGMRHVGEAARAELIAVAVESGRMTHNHPVAILGGVASALFAAFAIEGLRTCLSPLVHPSPC